ncbi:MAG: hypothetical protein JRJ87_04090 [Deltaproteobacteria bacterium]|nr:hypothetical protein [Deltaproteobacteria bacterium]
MTEERIPKERLNQIARRKLLALGIQTQPANDGHSLEGEIVIGPPAKLVNPCNQQAITNIQFMVEGHDCIRMISPPAMSRLMPFQFYDFDSQSALIEQLQVVINRRAAAVQILGKQVQQYGLQASLDADQMAVVARIELDIMSSVVLEGDERGLFAVRVEPRSSNIPSIALGNIPIDLGEFPEKVELEIHLSHMIEEAQKNQAAETVRLSLASNSPPSADASAEGALQGISLEQLTRAFGPEAVISTGVTVSKDLQVGEQQIRFTARHQQGNTFSGRMTSSGGTSWKDDFDLDSFPGVEDFVAGKMGTPQVTVVTEPAAVPGQTGTAEEMVLGYQLPVPGEVWVMNLLVEDESDTEIRYVGIDIDGQPYGAPRVLSKEVFQKTFAKVCSGSYRMLVSVTGVELGKVSYERLDSDRNQIPKPITCRLAPFVSNFVPESAAY